jgi:threonine-phosphate decarboxylase
LFCGLPGLELAYSVSPPEETAGLKRISRGIPDLLSLEAARTALKDSSYHRQTLQFIRKEKEMMFRELRGLPGLKIYDTDSNLFLLRAEKHAAGIRARMAASGILISDCHRIYGLDGSFLRASVMTHDLNRKFIRILKEALGAG